jgi:hypothetical protein
MATPLGNTLFGQTSSRGTIKPCVTPDVGAPRDKMATPLGNTLFGQTKLWLLIVCLFSLVYLILAHIFTALAFLFLIHA